jgi:superfamily II DNA or RNA helicase
MLGLSATPWRRDQLSKLIFWYLGDVHHEVEKNKLVESGDILAAEVVFRVTDFETFLDPINDYSKMLSELTLNDERNRMIALDVARESQLTWGICLVLSDRKKHCETLHGILKYKHRIQSALLTGDLSMEERQAVLEKLEKNEVKVLVATGQLLGEGFDSKQLSSLFLATPIKFSGRLLQYMGRVLRPSEGKARPRVYDYVDAKIGVLAASAKARQRIYERI